MEDPDVRTDAQVDGPLWPRSAKEERKSVCPSGAFKTNLGRVIREVEKQTPPPESSTAAMLLVAKKIHVQTRRESGKIYSIHEAEVQCIAKGKAGKKCEFGNKVSLAVTSKQSWVIGALSLEGNPYHGHTLSKQIKQVRCIVGSDMVKEVFVDRGYRGHKHEGAENVTVDRERRGKIPKSFWRRRKRRAAIEPIIGHMKSEHRLERNRLKGTVGNAINALLSAAAMNFGKLLGWVGRFWLFLRALVATIFCPRYAIPIASR